MGAPKREKFELCFGIFIDRLGTRTDQNLALRWIRFAPSRMVASGAGACTDSSPETPRALLFHRLLCMVCSEAFFRMNLMFQIATQTVGGMMSLATEAAGLGADQSREIATRLAPSSVRAKLNVNPRPSRPFLFHTLHQRILLYLDATASHRTDTGAEQHGLAKVVVPQLPRKASSNEKKQRNSWTLQQHGSTRRRGCLTLHQIPMSGCHIRSCRVLC
jgi:hypothetical protein